jgi:hypothetical protein
LECASAEFALVSLAVLSQIEDMFGHHFAHHVGVAWSSPHRGKIKVLNRASGLASMRARKNESTPTGLGSGRLWQPDAGLSSFWKFLKSQHFSLHIYKMPDGFLKLDRSNVIEPREGLFF